MSPRALVKAQAADPGLWFQAQTAPEAYADGPFTEEQTDRWLDALKAELERGV